MPPVERRDPRIWIRLEERFRVADTGAEAYLARMRTGVLRIHIPAPAGDLGPGHRHRIGREVAQAILAQTGWRALPLWLREGLAETLAGLGTEESYALLSTMKQEIAEMGDEVSVPAILAAWAKDGFPVGHAFRKSRAGRILRSLKASPLFRVRIDARFGPTVNNRDNSGVFLHYKDLRGEAAWRFPWPTTMQAWLDVTSPNGVRYLYEFEKRLR